MGPRESQDLRSPSPIMAPERNEHFFLMNKTAIELTGPCKHWHRDIILI